MPITIQGGGFQVGGIPVSGGSVVLTLSNPAATILATGGAATPSYTINLDSLGNMPVTSVYANAELTPFGTFYTAQVFSGPNGTGSQVIPSYTWVVGPAAAYSGTLYPNVLVLPPVSFVGAAVLPSTTVTFSATPAFPAASFSTFKITLTGNVTSSTMPGASTDQLIVFEITQDGVGGHTFVWPTNVHNPPTVNTAAGSKTVAAFIYDGANAWLLQDGTYARIDGSTPFTGQVIGPNGAAASPSFGFASETNTGFFRQTTNVIGATIAGVCKWLLKTTGILLGSGEAFAWSSNADPSAAGGDSFLSRIAANVFGMGSTVGGSNGELRLSKINKVTITQPATGSTLTIADGKTATVNNSLTLAGTDGTTLTGPASPPAGGVLAYGVPKQQIFTGNGTFTIPTGVTAVKVTVIGAGGGGGGSNNTTNGGGGGAGGVGIKWLSGLTPGNTIAVTVGALGAGATAGANTGSTGGASSIASGTQTIGTVTANGGVGGAGNGASSGGGSGGAVSGGDMNLPGGAGLPSVSGTNTGGQGATSIFAGSVSGGFQGAGNAASVYGTGGFCLLHSPNTGFWRPRLVPVFRLQFQSTTKTQRNRTVIFQ